MHYEISRQSSDLQFYERMERPQDFMHDTRGKAVNRAIFIVLSFTILLAVVGILFVTIVQEEPRNEIVQEINQYDQQIEQIQQAIETNRLQDAQSFLDGIPTASLQDSDVRQKLNELQAVVTLQLENQTEDEATTSQASALEDLETPEHILRAARTAFSTGQWETAIDYYEQLQAEHSDFETELVTQNLIVSSLNAASEIVVANPEDAVKLESALSFYRNVLSLEPENSTAIMESETLNTYLTGLRELRLGNPQQAVEVFTLIYRSRPGYLDGYAIEQLYNTFIELGDRAMRVDQRETATDYFNRAAALDVAEYRDVELRFAGLKRLAPLARSTPIPAPIVQAAPAAPTSTEEPTPELFPAVCPDSRAVIATPNEQEVVSGRTRVTGTSTHGDFAYYKLEIAPAGSSEFGYVFGREQDVVDNILGTMDTTTLPNGEYVLRLLTVDNTGNYPTPCQVSITIQN